MIIWSDQLNQRIIQSASMKVQHLVEEKQFYPYKQILITFIVVRYVAQQYINYRQLKKTLITDLPKQISEMGTTFQQFILSQAYAMDKLTFQMLFLSIKTCLQCLLITTNVRPFIWQNLDCIFPFINMDSQFQRALCYILIYMFISKAFMVPLEAYEMEIIDKKHKKVTKTLTGYFYDLIFDGILTLLALAPIIYGYLRVVQIGGKSYYMGLQVFVFVVTIVYAQIYPYVTIYFNRFKQLPEELKSSLYALALKTGFPSKQIKVKASGNYDMHGAQYHGIGNKHLIGIYQLLIQQLNVQQLLGVVCHEMGHWHNMHSLKSLLLYLSQNIALFYLYSFFANNDGVFSSFGFTHKSVFVGTALFYDLHSPIIAVFYFASLIMKRSFEFESDAYAVKIGYGRELKLALIKLYKDCAPKIRPDVLYAWVNFTHPTLWERIDYIDSLMVEREKKRQKWLKEQ